jgi:hypothetical protein
VKNKYEVHGDLTIIHLVCKGEKFVTFIDTEDLEKVNKDDYHWILQKSKNTYYVLRQENGRAIHLHREIMGVTEKGIEVDHINNIGLDNRKCNLRILNHAQNLQNQKPRKTNKSGCLNVRWYASRNKWRVNITVNQKDIFCGYYDNLEQAKKKAIEVRKKYFPYSKEAANQ